MLNYAKNYASTIYKSLVGTSTLKRSPVVRLIPLSQPAPSVSVRIKRPPRENFHSFLWPLNFHIFGGRSLEVRLFSQNDHKYAMDSLWVKKKKKRKRKEQKETERDRQLTEPSAWGLPHNGNFLHRVPDSCFLCFFTLSPGPYRYKIKMAATNNG